MRDHWPDWLSLLAGLWLAASPYVLGYAWIPEARLSALIAGIAAAVLAASRAFGLTGPWASWLLVPIAFWLLVAPSFLGFYFNAAAQQNSLGLGIALLYLGLLSAYLLRVQMPHHGHGATFAAAEPTEAERRRE